MVKKIHRHSPKITTLADGTDALLYMTDLVGEEDGPLIGISASLHGNENCGSQAIVEGSAGEAARPAGPEVQGDERTAMDPREGELGEGPGAATHGDHAVNALAATQVRRRQHRGLRRVFPYLVEDNRRKTRLLQGGDNRLYQADGHQSRVGNQQRPAHTLVPALAGQLQGTAAAIDDLADGIELESLHGRCSLVATW